VADINFSKFLLKVGIDQKSLEKMKSDIETFFKSVPFSVQLQIAPDSLQKLQDDVANAVSKVPTTNLSVKTAADLPSAKTGGMEGLVQSAKKGGDRCGQRG
jgi:hypothetical protein